ncbi:uncharacterized protein LOC114050336 [Vombatus ursinus]|uniref:uncharacterized protein LOC114050336 n=1 Tax=Vombatus ursinus TaxID=29139 RepID=UPI000FFD0D87|nr:uncharacterized protein LOC114050336 [Vombatus ursinus]
MLQSLILSLLSNRTPPVPPDSQAHGSGHALTASTSPSLEEDSSPQRSPPLQEQVSPSPDCPSSGDQLPQTHSPWALCYFSNSAPRSAAQALAANFWWPTLPRPREGRTRGREAGGSQVPPASTPRRLSSAQRNLTATSITASPRPPSPRREAENKAGRRGDLGRPRVESCPVVTRRRPGGVPTHPGQPPRSPPRYLRAAGRLPPGARPAACPAAAAAPSARRAASAAAAAWSQLEPPVPAPSVLRPRPGPRLSLCHALPAVEAAALPAAASRDWQLCTRSCGGGEGGGGGTVCVATPLSCLRASPDSAPSPTVAPSLGRGRTEPDCPGSGCCAALRCAGKSGWLEVPGQRAHAQSRIPPGHSPKRIPGTDVPLSGYDCQVSHASREDTRARLAWQALQAPRKCHRWIPGMRLGRGALVRSCFGHGLTDWAPPASQTSRAAQRSTRFLGSLA